MIIFEILMFTGIAALGIYATISDCVTGIIKNKVVLGCVVYAILLNIIYFGFFANDIIVDYALNNAIIWCIILALYFSDTWAGGDCKMSIAIAMLYPARCYFVLNGQITTLLMIIIFAFIFGYVYLAIDAVICLLTRRIVLTKKYVMNSLFRFFTSYFTALVYITGLSLLLQTVLPPQYTLNPVLVFAVYMCIAWLVSAKAVFQNKYILGGVAIIDVIICSIYRIIPLSTDYRIYLIMIILLLLQIIIRLRNYQTLPASKIQPKMILSTASSLLLAQAKPRCIKELSKENLGSRLTIEQAEAIRNWGRQNGMNLTIVRKIPFAGFIFLGSIVYFIIWSVS